MPPSFIVKWAVIKMTNKILIPIVCCLSLGCAVPQQYMQKQNQYQYPQSSESANILINLDSNIEKTVFVVDGKQLAVGRRVKVMLDDKEHTISAKPEGYVSKEEFLQPPFRNGQSLSFTFMLGDRIVQNKQENSPVLSNTATGPHTAHRQEIISDVDIISHIPTRKKTNNYALVIGVEEYRQKLPRADFASRDAQIVTEYLTKIIGYPEENVITLLNDKAAKSDFEKYIEKWLQNNVEKDSTVFIYYSGHGAPNPQNGDAYLVPFDGDPAFIDQTGYSIKRLYEHLAKLKSQNIIVALDACFSGSGGKSVIAAGSRSLVRREKVATNRLTILTASEDNQTSSTYEDKGHGLFTYYMLKKIKETAENNLKDGLTLEELYGSIKNQVTNTARKLKNNEQVPQFITPNDSAKKIRLF